MGSAAVGSAGPSTRSSGWALSANPPLCPPPGGGSCPEPPGAPRQGTRGELGPYRVGLLGGGWPCWRTLGLRDPKALEQLGVLDGQLDHLLDLLDLLVDATDHVVRRVGHLLHLHQAHQRVDLARQHEVQHVRVVLQRHAVVGLELGDVDGLVNIHDVLTLGVDLWASGRTRVSLRRRGHSPRLYRSIVPLVPPSTNPSAVGTP